MDTKIAFMVGRTANPENMRYLFALQDSFSEQITKHLYCMEIRMHVNRDGPLTATFSLRDTRLGLKKKSGPIAELCIDGSTGQITKRWFGWHSKVQKSAHTAYMNEAQLLQALLSLTAQYEKEQGIFALTTYRGRRWFWTVWQRLCQVLK